ncbi:cytochrome P450, partial [Diplogelasinospora grovesii]
MAISAFLPALDGATPSTLILIAAACAVSVLLASEFRSWFRLRHVPGPFWYSVSIFPLNKLTRAGKLSFELHELQKKYGPLVRIGPNLVMFGDADTYRRLSSVRSEFTKGPWYKPSRLLPDQDSLFSMRDEEKRRELRAKLTPGYSGKEGVGFEPTVDRNVAELVDLIERKYLSTPTDFRPIEFAHKAQYFALDVISELGFGEAIGFLPNDKDMYRYVEINDTFFPVMAVILNMPWMDKYLKSWPLNMALPKEGDQVGFGRLMGFATSLVNKRLAPGAEPGKDMMEAHIRNGLTRKELLAEVFLEMQLLVSLANNLATRIAGSDSTATATRMTLLCLVNTPAAMDALRREIDAGIAAGRISSPVRDAEAYQLPYLQAVIKEGLRMYPPSTGQNHKQSPKGGANIHGYYLPEGTQIGLNVVHMMRDRNTFGPDADVFRPERWLEAAKDEARFKEMSNTVELAFGYGKFQCLGKTVAAMELNKVFLTTGKQLLRRYDIAVCNPSSPLKLFDAAFWVCNDLWFRVSRR